MKAKIEVVAPVFFSTDPKKLRVADEGTGRIYILDKKDRVVAVMEKSNG